MLCGARDGQGARVGPKPSNRRRLWQGSLHRHNEAMRILVIGVLWLCSGCTTFHDSAHCKQCMVETKMPDSARYAMGTVEAELLRLCFERHEREAKAKQ